MNKVLKFWIVVFAVLLTPPAAFVAYLVWRSHQLEQARLAQPKCEIRVFMHKGQEVVETDSGVLIRAEAGRAWKCWEGKASTSYSRVIRLPIKESMSLHPKEDVIFINYLYTKSIYEMNDVSNEMNIRYKTAWYWNLMFPHKYYPLDLFPNWSRESREGPDPMRGKGGIDGPVLWGVRGTKSVIQERPFLFYCNFPLPPEASDNEKAYSHNIEWLVTAKMRDERGTGEACKGSVSDSKRGQVFAQIWLYSNQVPYIDGIVQAVSDYLSTILVEE